MLARRFAVGPLALAVLALAGTADGQTGAGQEKDKTILNRLDDFGKTIFGSILPAEKNKNRLPSTAPLFAAPGATDAVNASANNGRAGSVLDRVEASRRPSPFDPTGDDGGMMPENTPPPVSRKPDGTPKTVRRPLDVGSLFGESRPTTDPGHDRSSVSPRTTIGTPTAASSGAAETVTVKEQGLPPIHQRLAASRESVFDSEGDQVSPAGTPDTTAPTRKTEAPLIEPEHTVVPPPTASRTAQIQTPTRPVVARCTVPSATLGEAVSAEPALGPAISSPASVEPGAAAALPSDDGRLLMARQGPVLSVETLGPRRITVGRESTYEVSILNSGDVAGEDMVVFVSMPEWAEVAGAETSKGDVAANSAGPSGTLRWNLGHLDAKGRERLTLKIIPRQSRPFDLAVRWEYKPVASQAMIEVQEPRLHLQLEGPREVLYGKQETYRLRLSNVGNGAAENVAIMLMPIGGGENVPATHKLGVLAAGEEKVLDVQLTARQAGDLTVQVDARADGGVHAELAEKVLVRRAGLAIDVQGPKVQFVQVPADVYHSRPQSGDRTGAGRNALDRHAGRRQLSVGHRRGAARCGRESRVLDDREPQPGRRTELRLPVRLGQRRHEPPPSQCQGGGRPDDLDVGRDAG